jgi:hypothetical protein
VSSFKKPTPFSKAFHKNTELSNSLAKYYTMLLRYFLKKVNRVYTLINFSKIYLSNIQYWIQYVPSPNQRISNVRPPKNFFLPKHAQGNLQFNYELNLPIGTLKDFTKRAKYHQDSQQTIFLGIYAKTVSLHQLLHHINLHPFLSHLWHLSQNYCPDNPNFLYNQNG